MLEGKQLRTCKQLTNQLVLCCLLKKMLYLPWISVKWEAHGPTIWIFLISDTTVTGGVITSFFPTAARLFHLGEKPFVNISEGGILGYQEEMITSLTRSPSILDTIAKRTHWKPSAEPFGISMCWGQPQPQKLNPSNWAPPTGLPLSRLLNVVSKGIVTDDSVDFRSIVVCLFFTVGVWHNRYIIRHCLLELYPPLRNINCCPMKNFLLLCFRHVNISNYSFGKQE